MEHSAERYARTADAFDQQAAAYQARYMDVDWYDDTYDAFCALLPARAGLRVLEIGCGPGNITRYLLRRRPDLAIEAIDNAPAMVALARANNPQATCTVMDCRDLSQLPGPYDAVVCGFCLPYLARPDAARLLADCARLLPSGGLCYLSTMEGDYAASGPQRSRDGRHLAYVYYYQPADVQAWLTANGLELLSCTRKDAAALGLGGPAHLVFLARKA